MTNKLLIDASALQVLTWAKQHEQRLETALTEVLNNANLLEELLSWLQWAETTLVQRDTEPLPQDIPELKTLITEHQVGVRRDSSPAVGGENNHRLNAAVFALSTNSLCCAPVLADVCGSQMFMEEMTRKQPDVDKVTKTYKRKPAEAPSSLAERRGARKSACSPSGQPACGLARFQVAGTKVRFLDRQTPAAAAAAAGRHAGRRRKPTTQPALCQVAAGLAAGSGPPAQTQRWSGQAGGGKGIGPRCRHVDGRSLSVTKRSPLDCPPSAQRVRQLRL